MLFIKCLFLSGACRGSLPCGGLQKPSRGIRRRQTVRPGAVTAILIGFTATLLSGCGLWPGDEESDVQRGTIGYVQGFLGGVSADEPHAVVVGRDVLSSGGSAADAAVAMYFTMAVTLPSAAGLGGGGVCLIRDAKNSTTETLDFRAQAPRSRNGQRPTAIPGNPRGFFALHAKYGNLQWAELIRPAENKARFGFQVSRAFARELAGAGASIDANPMTRKAYAHPKEQRLIREGDTVPQPDLSATLARIRARGSADIYTGALAQQFVEDVNTAGGTLTYDEVRAFTPQWRPSVKVPFLAGTAFQFPDLGHPGGLLAAQMTAMLVEDDDYEDAEDPERVHLIATVTQRALQDLKSRLAGGNPAPDAIVAEEYIERLMAGYQSGRADAVAPAVALPIATPARTAGASLAVFDRRGNAVACTLSMNKAFGSGLIAPGSGILMAAPPPPEPEHSLSHALTILVSTISNSVFYASASSGGLTAQPALVSVAARATMNTPDTMEQAMARTRVHYDAGQHAVFVEEAGGQPIMADLQKRGHRVGTVDVLGRVNSVFCSSGLPAPQISCAAAADTRAAGLALSSN